MNSNQFLHYIKIVLHGNNAIQLVVKIDMIVNLDILLEVLEIVMIVL